MIDPPPLEPRRVRGIVFDLDGTLVDSYEAIAESLNFARRHFALPPLPLHVVRREVGHGLEALIAAWVGEDRLEAGVRLFRERYAEVYASGTRLLPAVLPTLMTLAARGYRMSVASNKPARFGLAICRALGIDGFLRSVQGPDTAGATKPDPVMLGRCLRDLGVDTASALYVGDMVLDVETAARAGVPLVLVSGGSSEVDELRRTGHPVLDSIGDLTALLP